MKSATILIVEDEAIVAADLAGKLGQLGYQVVGIASKGEEAVEQACHLRPEMVLMDIRLKGRMDGIEAAEAIRRHIDLPVIYLTAHSDTATLERAKLSQPFGYILKPFEERELSSTIEMALYKHQSDRQLREHRELLRVTLASIGDAVITCDADAKVNFINPVAEELIGWSFEEVRNWSVQDVFRLIDEQTGQLLEDPAALVLRDGCSSILANHTVLMTRNCREIPIEESAAPILSADGRVIGVVIVFRDVTEKRRAHDALRESEARLQLANDNLQSAYEELQVTNEEIQAQAEELQAQSEELQSQSEELQAQNQELALLWNESRLTRDELAESRERLQLALDSSGMATFVWDIVENRRSWDENVHRLLGTNPEAFTGAAEDFFRAIHPDDRSTVQAALSRTIETNGEYETEYRAVWPDGTIRHIAARGKVHRDHTGQAVRMAGVCWDITDRKRAEEERLMSVEFLRLVNESRNSADLIRSATLFFHKKSGCEAVGIRLREGDDYPYFEAHGFPEEFVLLENKLCNYNENGEVIRDSRGNPVIECMCGNVIRERFDPSKPFFTTNGSFWSNCTTELLASTSEADRQVRTRNRCNSEGYESVALIPLRLGQERLGLLQLNDREQGRFTPAAIALWERLSGYLAVALKKFKTEEALHVSYQRTSLLAETTAKLLASDSPQEVVEDLCRKVMESLDCQAFFNFLVDEEMGKLHLNACTGIPEEEVKKLEWLDYGIAVCGCAARDGIRIIAEDISNSPDPRTELVKSYGIQAYACHPLMAQGRVLGTLSFGASKRPCFTEDELALMKTVADHVAMAMDRKKTEENLKHAREAAEAASRTKSLFLANMSHELRTPMTGVLGMLDLVLAGNLETGQREYIEIAQTSGRTLVRILNDILDLTKIEKGKFSIDEKPFPVRKCVENTFNILLPLVKNKGLDFDFIVSDNVPETLIGDQTRLCQVLLNLAANAVKFTEKGKVELNVMAGKRASSGKREFTFSVADTGIGIPDEKKECLFQAFSQVDESHSRSFGGSGLGLVISKEIVNRMGGTISLTSKVGKGSTFFCTIPLGEAEPALDVISTSVISAATGEVPNAGETAKPRLLGVEDDPTIRQVLGSMFQLVKYEIDFAENGRKAIEMWENGKYDLILMDVQMPLMNGFEATSAIREKERASGGHIPIIAMTAHAFKEDEKMCLDAGMDAYISKPIDFMACLKLIREIIGKNL